LNTNAQEEKKETTDFGSNEIKINSLYLLVEVFEISYERNITNHSSLGVSLFIPFKDDIDYNYMVNPHFKVFFGKKPAQGFFVEANAAFASLNKYKYEGNLLSSYSYSYDRVKTSEFTFGMGIAVGCKFVLNDSFVLDVYGGLGRFFNSEIIEAYPRFGISLGYRFK
jgi:hypothetical protein